MRISRPCYDKYHRCPGWSGGGMKLAKVKRCKGGSLATVINYEGPWRWKWHQCPECKVWVMPYNWVKFAPANIKFKIRMWWKYGDWRYRGK